MSKKIINKNGTVTIVDNFKTSVKIEQIGKKGNDGKSSYDIWLENGNIGTEQDFLNSLKGQKGDNGEGVLTGGTTGQVLVKKSNTDFDTEWKAVESGMDTNTLVALVCSTNIGVANNNTFVASNISNYNSSGATSAPVPGYTNEYDRAKNTFRNQNTPTSLNNESYHVPIFNKYFGTAPSGGFSVEIDFVIESNSDSLHKFYAGEMKNLVNIPSLANGPSGYINCLGFGYDSTDSIFHIYINDATPTPIKIPLSNFTGNLIESDYTARVIQNPYLVSYTVNPGGTEIIFKFKHLLSGREGTYILNNPSKKPAGNVYLRTMIGLSSGTAGLAQADAFSVYSYHMMRKIR